MPLRSLRWIWEFWYASDTPAHRVHRNIASNAQLRLELVVPSRLDSSSFLRNTYTSSIRVLAVQPSTVLGIEADSGSHTLFHYAEFVIPFLFLEDELRCKKDRLLKLTWKLHANFLCFFHRFRSNRHSCCRRNPKVCCKLHIVLQFMLRVFLKALDFICPLKLPVSKTATDTNTICLKYPEIASQY